MNEIEFLREFTSEVKCLHFFKSIIESKQFDCNFCGNKKLHWDKSEKLWRCNECTRKISIKSLCFMKNSKSTYKEWLHAIYFLLESKKPISTKELQRKLGAKYYKRVYYMAMKIRYEVVRMNKKIELSNYSILEKTDVLDFNDGKLHSIPPQTMMFYGKQKNSPKLRMLISMKDFEANQNESEMKIKVYSFKKLLSFQKESMGMSIPCSKKNYVINKKMDLLIQQNTNRVIEGIHHGVSRFHLQAYLDEFSFKYNNRMSSYSNFLRFCENLEIGNHRHT